MRRRIRRLAPTITPPVPTIGLAMGGGGGSAPAIQVDGALAVCSDVGSYVSPGASVINAVYIRCETPGTAGSTIIDVHLNGVTIFTVQGNRPILAWNDPDGVAKSGVPDVISLAENDVLTADIDQVATGAEDLVVVIDIDLVVGLVGPAGAAGGTHNILDAAVHTDSALDVVTRGSIIYGNSTPKWDELPIGAAGRVLTSDGTDASWAVPAAAGLYSDYIHIRDEKAAGTEGGGFTQGAWRTRDLTVELSDTGGDATLASNQITLEAGTYRCLISCPAFNVNQHKARLYNISDASTEIVGTTELSNAADLTQTIALVRGRFTLAAQKVLEVQHYCAATKAVQGFGVAFNIGVVEVYTEVELWKEA